MNSAFFTLLLAILSEIIGTTSLKASDGFTRLLPSTIVVIGYACSFYLMSVSLKQIPLGVAYAIWSGLGTAGIVAVGALIWHEKLDIWRILGIALIIIGVVMVSPRH